MQPANGIHLIGISIEPNPPAAGEEVCVIFKTPVDAGSLEVLITVGGTIIHDGPPPTEKEICFETSVADQGKAVTAFATSSQGANPIAIGSASDLLQ